MSSVAFKEINELLDGAILAVKDYQELMADGKIDFRDFSLLIKISQQIGAFNAALQGLNNLSRATLGQMEAGEVEALVAKVMVLAGMLGFQVSKA